MTDKQIIIDGVDVADCEHLNACNKKMKCVILQDDVCEIDPYCEGCNCYYKQLKRKEQECEELKKIINEAKNSKLDLNSFFAIEATVGEYQLELDQLKAKHKEAVNDLLSIQYKLADSNTNLRQTLTEIKEIAEAESYLSPQSTRLLVHKILQKISECEVMDE